MNWIGRSNSFKRWHSKGLQGQPRLPRASTGHMIATSLATGSLASRCRVLGMPSKSPAQHRLMEAVAHDPKFAKKAGIPQSVGRDFAAADEARSAKRKAAAKKLYPHSKES